ncbi:hypothetical protein FACS189432_03930 [Bacteroidia bacterium]|nr:hypothetical protein FACS189426_11040 [Bacteroidia bacterium]GHT27421.1 hypothetical protein FACS189432_03930 [Bacteroidia bacterium]GHV71111.1 hypothetical protein FACS189420_4960 [Bacteroidia bacterium]
MNIQERHTAGAQSLGFDYQFYYFVLLALELKQGQKIGFEVKDDIHIDKENETILFQAKHTIHENQNLTTLDVDLWKTLNNWVEFIKTGDKNFLEKHSFVLVTNKNDENNEFIDTLSSFKANQDIDAILLKLKELKNKTKDETIKKYINNVISLGKTTLKIFLPKVTIETNAINIIAQVKNKILETTRQARFVDAIFDNLTSNILATKYLEIGINRNDFEISYEDFNKRFGKCFSIAFEKQILPKRNYPLLDFNNLEKQTFIKQLLDIEDIDKNKDVQLIRKYTTQMLNAIRNFSDWLEAYIILPTDIDVFEENNVSIWRNEYRAKYRQIERQINEGKSISELENNIRNLGTELVDYLRKQDLSIQGFQPLGIDMSNGHFYALSDSLKIGWHYDWENKYKNQ